MTDTEPKDLFVLAADLVGPSASGKSTLFDAIAFLGDPVSDALEAAVENRTSKTGGI